MRMPSTPTDRAPSALWLWGFWIYFAAAFLAFVVSAYAPAPVGLVFRCLAGVLLFVAGIHQLRVGKYKRATRSPYTVWGFDSFLMDRQTGWGAMIAGVVVFVGALVGL